MNPLIAMAGEVPDLAGAIMRGRQGYQQQVEAQNANALRDYMRTNGAAVMQGDQNALAGLAGFDPRAALAVQGDRLGLDQQRLSMDATRQDMAQSAERLQMAREQARQNAADRAADLTAQQRAEEGAKAERIAAMATQAYRQGPEAWDRFNDQFEEYDSVSYDDAPVMISGVLGVIDELKPAEGPEWRDASPEELARYGATAGQIRNTGEFKPINPPSGMSIQTADGTVIQQGPGVKPLTESQSKDNVYATRAKGAAPDLDTYEGALTDLGQRATEAVPFGLGNFAQTPEFQVGRNAALEFGSAILRKDTGAAMTNEEIEITNRLFIPQPGDSPEVIARKRGARARAIAGIESGMSAQQILSSTMAADVGQTGADPAAPQPAAPPAPAAAAPAAPNRLRYNPETDALEPY